MRTDKLSRITILVLVTMVPLIALLAIKRSEPLTSEEKKSFSNFREAIQGCQSSQLVKYLDEESVFQAGGAYFFNKAEKAKFLSGNGIFYHFLCDSKFLKDDMGAYYWAEAGFISLKDALKVGTEYVEGRLREKDKFFLQFRVGKNKYFVNFEMSSTGLIVKLFEVVYLP
ncbi:MAG: hypothetical protein LDLANPLL_01587 [Turneriella sp.]|nr:hypothetical protein [Turneriella sp.]